MVIWGWGTKSRAWDLGNGKFVVAEWGYFDLFWCPVAGKIKWHLRGDNRSEDAVITHEHASQLLNGDTGIGFWNRCGILIPIAAFILLVTVGGN